MAVLVFVLLCALLTWGAHSLFWRAPLERQKREERDDHDYETRLKPFFESIRQQES